MLHMPHCGVSLRQATSAVLHTLPPGLSPPGPPPDADEVLLVHADGLHHPGQQLIGSVGAHP